MGWEAENDLSFLQRNWVFEKQRWWTTRSKNRLMKIRFEGIVNLRLKPPTWSPPLVNIQSRLLSEV